MKKPEIVTDIILSDDQADIWDLLCYEPSLHELLIGGAAGGGKSTLLCMWQIWRRCSYPKTRGFIGRYNFTTLQDTTMKTFRRTWDKYGRLNPQGVTMRIVGHTAYFSNGSEILFRWLKESGSTDQNFGLGSLELTDAAIDEVTEVSEKVVEMLNSRIRFKLVDGEPKLAMTCNPAINWVKYKWIKTKKGVPVKLEDYQRFCPLGLDANPDREFANQYRRQLEKLEGAEKQRLLYGNWDEIDNERPWFFSFDRAEHVVPSPEEYQVDEFEPIYLSFDFNLEPMTCTAGQYVIGKGLSVFRSHEVKGTTELMCEELLKFGYQDHIGGILITGDVSGKARSTVAGLTKYGEISTDYSVIKEKLGLVDGQIVHTGKQNPRLKYSRRLVNHALERGVVTIYEYGCPELIEDVKSAVAKPDDTIIKNADNGRHHADNFRYLIHMVFKYGYKDVNEAAEFLNFEGVGTIVTTPNTAPPAGQQSKPPSFQEIQNRLKHRR